MKSVRLGAITQPLLYGARPSVNELSDYRLRLDVRSAKCKMQNVAFQPVIMVSTKVWSNQLKQDEDRYYSNYVLVDASLQREQEWLPGNLNIQLASPQTKCSSSSSPTPSSSCTHHPSSLALARIPVLQCTHAAWHFEPCACRAASWAKGCASEPHWN
jgi:hypothetical protein